MQSTLNLVATGVEDPYNRKCRISEERVTALETEIANAEELVKKTDAYTADSLKALQIAINNAKRVLASDTKTQESLTHYSQGISPLKKVAQSQTIIDMLDAESGDSQMSMSLLNQALLVARNREKFKKYDSAMTMIDNGIGKIVHSSDDFDLSLIELQKEVNKYLND